MPSFLDLLVVAGMMFLRIGVPALVVVALAYGLKRLDRRWEREAREYAETQPSEQPAAEQPALPKPKPGLPARKPAPSPAPALPFVPPPAVKDQRVQPGLAVAAPQACWDAKGCSDTMKAQCAAPQHPEMPCWQARFQAEGHIPEDCVKCDVFQRYPTM